MDTIIIISFIVATIISAALIPIVKKIGNKLNVIAIQNHRTIHNGTIVRMGGYAIYLSFIICVMFFLKTDTQINSILIASFLIFMVGLYDDINDIAPKKKIVVELIAATVIVFYGNIRLSGIDLPFIGYDLNYLISIIITYGWIIGITNAINLIDGLDGLSAGISTIVLVTISFTSMYFGRTDIASLAMILAGSAVGFLFYNFHPASIFMGDCGALFLGFMISVISLLGFGYKSSTFFTLGAPIVVLAVPILDTLMAIIRRKLRGQKFSDADKEHLHHQLMFNLNLGQKKSVLILYLVTILFSVLSYVYLYDKKNALGMFVVLLVIFELFVEYTEMISRKYRPILTFINLFIKSEKLPVLSDYDYNLPAISKQIKEENMSKQAYFQRKAKIYERAQRIMKKKRSIGSIVLRVVLALLLSLAIGIGLFYILEQKNNNVNNQIPEDVEETKLNYTLSSNPTILLQTIYDDLEEARISNDEEKERTYVAAYFVSDFFTWSNKSGREDIGAIRYVWPQARQSFASFAIRDYYNNFLEHKTTYGIENLPEVESYIVNSIVPSDFRLAGYESNNYYDISISIEYVNKEAGMPTATLKSTMLITLIEDELYYVVGVDHDNIGY